MDVHAFLSLSFFRWMLMIHRIKLLDLWLRVVLLGIYLGIMFALCDHSQSSELSLIQRSYTGSPSQSISKWGSIGAGLYARMTKYVRGAPRTGLAHKQIRFSWQGSTPMSYQTRLQWTAKWASICSLSLAHATSQ